jgi:putative endonuclease
MKQHLEIGKYGEDLAARYEILARNVRIERLELDIIARKDEVVVFVEVKTRQNVQFGEPYENVTEEKQERLIRAAEEYMSMHFPDSEMQLDIISVVLNLPEPKIHHITDAFR